MLAMRVFVFVALRPLTEASASCAKSASLLSLRADMPKNKQGVAESNGSNATNGTACQNCSMSTSNHTLNPKLEELVKNVLQNDMNESADMPDPVGDSGGSLGQNLEYLGVPLFESGFLACTKTPKTLDPPRPADGCRWSITCAPQAKTWSYLSAYARQPARGPTMLAHLVTAS